MTIHCDRCHRPLHPGDEFNSPAAGVYRHNLCSGPLLWIGGIRPPAGVDYIIRTDLDGQRYYEGIDNGS